MKEIVRTLRNETYFTSLESSIAEDLDVRVYDKIVEKLDLKKLGLEEKERKSNAGRPKYSDKDMIKLYLYGYRNAVRSGRKLENACKYDIRFQWLLNGATPDANTINDFRKNNKELLVNVFYEVNRMFYNIELMKIDKVSQDGFKIRACNSKEKNYTVNKVIDRIKREEKEINGYEEEKKKFKEYLQELEKSEESEKLDEEIKNKREELKKIEEEIEEVTNRKNNHEEMLKEMKEKGISQISKTDPESRLMKNNGKFDVAYNVQSAVDMESHMTTAFEIDDNPADIGSMNETAKIIKREYGEEQISYNTTDKGYNSRQDMIECLEMGVVPQVTPQKKGTKEVEIETNYEEKEITEEEKKSTRKEDIKKCLRAGVIPECYKEVISEIKVEEKEEKIKEVEKEEETRSEEEIREEAIKNQTFERDIRSGLVYCPEGETLSKKSTNNGKTRYCNKLACKNCKNPCTSSKYKTVDFSEGQKTLKPNKSTSEKPRKVLKTKTVTKKVVKIILKLDEELLKKRMQTSEHSQGTMKTVDNHGYFNVKGKEMVKADVAIHFTASNIRRSTNMLKIPELLDRIENLEVKIEGNRENNSDITLNISKKVMGGLHFFIKKCKIFIKNQKNFNFWLT